MNLSIGLARNNAEVADYMGYAKCIRHVTDLSEDWIQFIFDPNIDMYLGDAVEGRVPPENQTWWNADDAPDEAREAYTQYRSSFSGRLREMRLIKDLSIPELAVLADMPRQTIHQLERGERQPSLETAERLAKALGKKLRVFEGCGIRPA